MACGNLIAQAVAFFLQRTLANQLTVDLSHRNEQIQPNFFK
jgi:hypothetical protein